MSAGHGDPIAHNSKQAEMLECWTPNAFAHLCFLAGANRIVGISDVLARLEAPGQRSEHVVITQTRNTLDNSNNYGAQPGRVRP